MFNPVNPVSGIEAGAGKKHGTKRQRSDSTAANCASSSKRIASGHPPDTENDDYSLAWFTKNKLDNIHMLAIWAKYRFRFNLITTMLPNIAPIPYLAPQGRILLAEACYSLSQTALNITPETSSSSPWIHMIQTDFMVLKF